MCLIMYLVWPLVAKTGSCINSLQDPKTEYKDVMRCNNIIYIMHHKLWLRPIWSHSIVILITFFSVYSCDLLLFYYIHCNTTTFNLFTIFFLLQVLQSAKEQIKWSILKWFGPDNCRMQERKRTISSPKAIFHSNRVKKKGGLLKVLVNGLLYLAINQLVMGSCFYVWWLFFFHFV